MRLCSSVGGSARNCAICLCMTHTWSVLQPTGSCLCLRCAVHNFSHRFVVPNTPMISELFCQRGSTSRFQWCAWRSFSPSLRIFPSLRPSFTLAPHLGSDPDTTVEIISDKRIWTICIQPIKKKKGGGSYHRRAHSNSWGRGQMGALIGPVKAANTPLWSGLTAIGWLFISSHISVDPAVASSHRFLIRLHTRWNAEPKMKSGRHERDQTAKCFSRMKAEENDCCTVLATSVCRESLFFSQTPLILLHTVFNF